MKKDSTTSMASDLVVNLKNYNLKRNFTITPEPQHFESSQSSKNLKFVIQKHWASSLHYDFRLELNGTLKSWAVPKGPSFDPSIKRLAVQVEDHPISYADFEGTIPKKQYGAGDVIIWDEGIWIPLSDPEKALQDGNLKFQLIGTKLAGHWALVRMKGQGDKQQPWLLLKEKDKFARKQSEYDVVRELPDSIKSLSNAEKKADFTLNTDLSSTEAILKESGAIDCDLPKIIEPQLATLVDRNTQLNNGWIFEIKFDGYRVLTRVDGKKIHLFSRNGIDWTQKLQGLVNALKSLNLPSGFYDGELVVKDDKGLPSFGLLQKSFESDLSDSIEMYLFDVPYYAGMDLRNVPLVMRKVVLSNLFRQISSSRIKLSEQFDMSGKSLLESACKMGLEGIIAKQVHAKYISGRSSTWLKLKCINNQEFIIAGYTKPLAGRKHFGALILSVIDEGKYLHVGNVGSGFTAKELLKLKNELDAIQTNKSFIENTDKIANVGSWVKSELVVEISFSEWTAEGKLRQPVYKGLRLDKKPSDIQKEIPQHVDTFPPKLKANSTKKIVSITNAERLIDDSGATKQDLYDYYQLVSDQFFPHFKNRPVSLLRAQEGVNKETFFQKHTDHHKIKGFSEIVVNGEIDPFIEVISKDGIRNATQLNVIEFHTENCFSNAMNLPNRIIFDLDPGDGLEWKKMQEATLLLHKFLIEISLPSFIKTSGGKGFHLVIPIIPQYEWDTIKTLTEIIAKHVAKILPTKFVAISGPRNRKGKIFIDYLRNGAGSTTVSAWSARARNGLGVSVPIHVDEVMEINSGDYWSIKNIQSRLLIGNDPWNGYDAASVDVNSTLQYFLKKE